MQKVDELKVYEGARHEILNELNRQEVYKDIIDWIKDRI
jgi:alpha-beta hydrolase superfamily lysophospholipase